MEKATIIGIDLAKRVFHLHRAIIASGRVEPLALPARSPNLNAYAEP